MGTIKPSNARLLTQRRNDGARTPSGTRSIDTSRCRTQHRVSLGGRSIPALAALSCILGSARLLRGSERMTTQRRHGVAARHLARWLRIRWGRGYQLAAPDRPDPSDTPDPSMQPRESASGGSMWALPNSGVVVRSPAQPCGEMPTADPARLVAQVGASTRGEPAPGRPGVGWREQAGRLRCAIEAEPGVNGLGFGPSCRSCRIAWLGSRCRRRVWWQVRRCTRRRTRRARTRAADAAVEPWRARR